MNELKESVGLSSELTVEVLIRGALSLEQRESEKVFQLLKKGLENMIAQKKIHNRVAKKFKQFKQQEEKNVMKRIWTPEHIYRRGCQGPMEVVFCQNVQEVKEGEVVFPYYYVSNNCGLRIFKNPPKMTEKPLCENRDCLERDIPAEMLRPDLKHCTLCGHPRVKPGEIPKWQHVCQKSSCRNFNSGRGNNVCDRCYNGSRVEENKGKGLTFSDCFQKS